MININVTYSDLDSDVISCPLLFYQGFCEPLTLLRAAFIVIEIED